MPNKVIISLDWLQNVIRLQEEENKTNRELIALAQRQLELGEQKLQTLKLLERGEIDRSEGSVIIATEAED